MFRIDPPPNVPIVILSMPRTGSNALCVALSIKNNRKFVGESFNHLTPGIYTKEIEEKILSYVKLQNVVLNVHTHIMDDVWKKYLHNFFCISISRRDRLSQFVSFMISELTNYTREAEVLKSITTETYTTEEILQRYERFCKMEEEHKEWIQYCECQVYFEDVVDYFIPNTTEVTPKSPYYDQLKKHVSQTINTFSVDGAKE